MRRRLEVLGVGVEGDVLVEIVAVVAVVGWLLLVPLTISDSSEDDVGCVCGGNDHR